MRFPKNIPNNEVLRQALQEYRQATTYWYVPKARALNDANIAACSEFLHIVFEEFLDSPWTVGTQDALLDRLTDVGINRPRVPGGSLRDRTALPRIMKVLLETLGLLWVQDDKLPVITDAGLDLLLTGDDSAAQRNLIEAQVAKLQYPNPLMNKTQGDGFQGILPYLFTLQVLQRVDYRLTFEEYDLFVNLAKSQDDFERIVDYVTEWRRISADERDAFREAFHRVPFRKPGQRIPRLNPIRRSGIKGTRHKRIGLNASYQRAFFGYPSLLQIDRASGEFSSSSQDALDRLITDQSGALKIATFESPEAWIAYFGDPQQQPSWFTYVALAVEAATTPEEAEAEFEQSQEKLTEEEAVIVRRLQIEKAIESSYAEHTDLLHLLEPGLMYQARQVHTPIGRIDLLCRGLDGKYVVIEIKANGAEDAVFGQILRYMGWIHRNFDDGENNVRGIILASHFPEKARYSRIGLLKTDADQYLKFHRHGFAVEEV